MRRLAAVAGLVVAFACAEGFAPGYRVSLAIIPVFAPAAPGLLTNDLDELRVRVARVPSGSLVIDTTVAVDSSGSVDLPLTIPLLAESESFEVLLQGIRSSDAVVLYSGLDTVVVLAGVGQPPPVQLPVVYVGPCGPASGCQVTAGPVGTTLAQGDSVLMTAVVDSAGLPVLGVPVTLLNLDTVLVRLRGSRFIVARTGTSGGPARVVAQIRSDADTLLVTVAQTGTPAIGLNPTSVPFAATQFGPNPNPATVSVTNAGVGTLSGLSAAIAYGPGATGWLAANLSGATAPATLTLTPTLGALAPNAYTATVTVSSTVPGVASQTVNVTFTVNAATAASVIVTPGYGALRTPGPGNTVQLSDTVKDASGNVLSPTVTWTSRSPAVATVSTSGLVTAQGAGSAVIVAQAGSVADSMIVAVGNAGSAPGDMLFATVTNGRAFGVRPLGQAVAIDVRVDQLATADSLGSYNARFSWNPAILRFDSTSAGTYAAPTVNDSSSIGVLRFAGIDAISKSGPLVLTRLWFTALATGNDGHTLQVSEISGVSPNFFNYFTAGRYVLVSGAASITP